MRIQNRKGKESLHSTHVVELTSASRQTFQCEGGAFRQFLGQKGERQDEVASASNSFSLYNSFEERKVDGGVC